MASSRLHNALLFVIALFLGLLVVHLYSDVDLVSKAQAQAAPPPAPAADDKDVHLQGCLPDPDTNFGCKWLPVRVNQYGYVITTSPPH